MKTIRASGSVDVQGRLHLDEPLTAVEPGRVRVLVIVADDAEWAGEESDFNEAEWLRATASNPAFAFLDDPAEDIYTMNDGKPFRDEG